MPLIKRARKTAGMDSPIGEIKSFMRTTAPRGYLACDGTTYNIADYPLLASLFASDFGASNFFGGDGTTTFKVPDLRGEFLRGTGTNSHANQGSGDNVGSHQDGTEHINATYRSNNIGAFPANINDTVSVIGADLMLTKHTNARNYIPSSIYADTSAGERFAYYTSRPTNTSVLYCIRAY